MGSDFMKHRDFIDIISDKGYLFSALIGFLLGLVTLFFSMKIWIPIFVVALIIVGFLFVLWILLIMLIRLKQAKPESIRLNQFLIDKNNGTHILLNPNDILTVGSYITLYWAENGFENYLATGIVINIQDNRYIQANIIDWKSNSELKQKALYNDVLFIRKISVKPIITNNFIGGN